MKRFIWMARRISLNLLAVCLAIFSLFAGFASAQTVNDSMNQSGTPSLGDVLETDGTIKKGVVGGFSAAGFEMNLDENGRPRFVPSEMKNDRSKYRNHAPNASPNVIGVVCNDAWDPRFYNAGFYDDSFYHSPSIAAVASDGNGNLFMGGKFTNIDNVVTNHIVRYNIATDTWSPLAGNGLKEFGGPYVVVEAMAISGNNLFVAGRFSRTFDNSVTNLTNIARYDIAADAWFPLAGNGLHYALNNGNVSALAISGNYLFAGGLFRRTANDVTTNLNNIARYDITANTWSPLAGNGLGGGSGSVSALAISGNVMFAGGDFTQSHNGTTTNLNRIAKYDIAAGPVGSWSALAGNGLSDASGFGGSVRALALSGNDLFVGGSFARTHNSSTPNLNNIARFDVGANAWFALTGTGLSDAMFDTYVFALAIKPNALPMMGGDLYVGGFFIQTADGMTLTNVNNIARYTFPANPATPGMWDRLPGTGLSSTVSALAIEGDDLFVGGLFTKTADGTTITNINRIARYKITPNIWAALGSNNGIGLNSTVKALAVDLNGTIYVGGIFTPDFPGAAQNLNYIARYIPGTGWSALSGAGLNNGVASLAVAGNILFVGGNFTQTFDGTSTGLNGIAQYNTTTNTWSPLAHGGLNADATALLVSGGELFVGGFFTQTNDTLVTLNRIARYNFVIPGGQWFPFANNGLDGNVNALVMSGNYLFVGGLFTKTFDNTVTNLNNVARYDLTVGNNIWSSLAGNGLNGQVNALAISGVTLFAGGVFSQSANGTFTLLNHVAASNINNNNVWNSLTDNGLNGDVYALAASGDTLFVGGNFTESFSGAIELDHGARYTPSTLTWTQRPEANDTIFAFALSGNDLFIGGVFTQSTPGCVARYIAHNYLQQWRVTPFSRGFGGTDWHDASNWSTGTAPAANSNAAIPPGSGNLDITSADVTMNDLVLGGGVLTLGAGRTLTINGILVLGGTITGEGTVVITNCKQDGIMGGDATGYIRTALVRCVNDTGTFNFPVGTANGYSPVTVKNVTGTGNISIKANEGMYSNPATGLPGNRLARWWQIENPGGGVTEADLHFGYLQSDIAGNENTYKAYRIAGGTASLMVSSVNTFSNIVTAPNVTAFSDWTLGELSPTPASVSVGGRVSTANGIGISKAFVLITNGNGLTRAALTNAFGFYRFDDITVGETYVISVQSKRYQFANNPQVLTITEAIRGLDFVAQP